MQKNGSDTNYKTNGDSEVSINQEMEDRLASEQEERGYWGHKAEFILSCVGLSVGIGNVWRFPYVAYDNGGGAFLIPYLFMLFIIGKPIYYMELAIGQYARLGPLQMFQRMAPISIGVGISMLYVCLIVTIYYNVIMSYSIFYSVATLIAAFQGGPLPWDVCNETWNDVDTCVVRSSLYAGVNNTETTRGLNFSSGEYSVAPEQYFERGVVQKKVGEVEYGIGTGEDIGGIVWELFGCLVFCWVVVYICLAKGIKTSGKVVYVTATLPYALLLLLFFRGVTLPGAGAGVLYFITPTWEKLGLVSVSETIQLLTSLITQPPSRPGERPQPNYSSPYPHPGAASSCSAHTTVSKTTATTTLCSSPRSTL